MYENNFDVGVIYCIDCIGKWNVLGYDVFYIYGVVIYFMKSVVECFVGVNLVYGVCDIFYVYFV